VEILESVVIGAGQAGLSSSYHLKRRGIEHVVLDSNSSPGGAWQHRWDALTMSDVHRVADLPDEPIPPARDGDRANTFVPGYFGDYERTHDLPVVRPVQVQSVHDLSTGSRTGLSTGSGGDLSTGSRDGVLRVDADTGSWLTRTIVNATGTWTRPFIPYYPGAETFLGEQLHTVDYPGPEHFRGKRVLVVGGGASAVQFLGAIRPLADTVWVTRREPVWRTGEFSAEIGREVVAKVEERVRQGLPPRSVVSVTGLMLRPQEREAERLGAYERRPMFSRIEPDGVRWGDGAFERVDAIIWATGFRPAIEHLAPLHLRSPRGGIQLDGTVAVADPRVQMVGYGPSASTIGANRAGRAAARGVSEWLRAATPADQTRSTTPAR
jgi:cation diffusion facilitator CzcD-associated flavoprotein CzcO